MSLLNSPFGSVGATTTDAESAWRFPWLANVKECYVGNTATDGESFLRAEEWDNSLIGDFAKFAGKALVVNPFMNLAIMVEGVARGMLGLSAWTLSWIPTSWSESVHEKAVALLKSAKYGIFGGALQGVVELSSVPEKTIAMIKHVWTLTHKPAELEPYNGGGGGGGGCGSTTSSLGDEGLAAGGGG